MLKAVTTDLVSSAAPKIFSYPQAGPADYTISGYAPCKGGTFEWVSPTVPPGNRSSRKQSDHGGALISVPRIGDSASVQAIMLVNAKQASQVHPPTLSGKTDTSE